MRAAPRFAPLLLGPALVVAWAVVLGAARDPLDAAKGWLGDVAGPELDRGATPAALGSVLDGTLSAAALAVCVPLLLWVTLVVVGTALGRLPGAVGRGAQRCADAVTPVACRRLARAAVGLTLTSATVGVGLTAQAAPAPSVDELPGVGRPVVSAPADPETPTATPAPSAVPTRTATPAPPSTRTATPTPAPTPASTPRPRAAAAPDATDSDRTVSRPASPGRAEARPPSTTAAQDRSAARQVVVRRGDCLWDIAERWLGPGATDAAIALEWPRWYAANHAVIGADPDLLLPGTVLRAPAPEEDPWP